MTKEQLIKERDLVLEIMKLDKKIRTYTFKENYKYIKDTLMVRYSYFNLIRNVNRREISE